MNSKIKELRIDEWIWVVFIVLSILNICGDELEKKFYTSSDVKSDRIAKKIFTLTVIISFIIYIYLVKRNYDVVKKLKSRNCDSSLCEIRLIGSIFIVVGAFLTVYFQINSSSSNNPSLL